MKKTEIIEMLKGLGLIVVEEENTIYIITDELMCEEVEEVITVLEEKSNRYVKNTWSESFFIGEYEIIANYE